jgi:hypothetical protein
MDGLWVAVVGRGRIERESVRVSRPATCQIRFGERQPSPNPHSTIGETSFRVYVTKKASSAESVGDFD